MLRLNSNITLHSLSVDAYASAVLRRFKDAEYLKMDLISAFLGLALLIVRSMLHRENDKCSMLRSESVSRPSNLSVSQEVVSSMVGCGSSFSIYLSSVAPVSTLDV